MKLDNQLVKNVDEKECIFYSNHLVFNFIQMATTQIIRKDVNGQIISKTNNKNYHICFKENIDIINVKSYKIYNKIREGEFYEDVFFQDEEDNDEKKENFIETYEKTECDECPNKDPKSFSKGGCSIF